MERGFSYYYSCLSQARTLEFIPSPSSSLIYYSWILHLFISLLSCIYYREHILYPNSYVFFKDFKSLGLGYSIDFRISWFSSTVLTFRCFSAVSILSIFIPLVHIFDLFLQFQSFRKCLLLNKFNKTKMATTKKAENIKAKNHTERSERIWKVYCFYPNPTNQI